MINVRGHVRAASGQRQGKLSMNVRAVIPFNYPLHTHARTHAHIHAHPRRDEGNALTCLTCPDAPLIIKHLQKLTALT